MQCIVMNSRIRRPFNIFPLNPDYVAARSLQSLRSNNVSTLVEPILFADDTNLFMSHKDPVYLAASLNSELNKLSTWFKANKLSLNLKKTNFMLFKPRQKRYHFPMQICINEQRIEQVKETVFLGVVLDEHLSWKPHISQVARKISKSIGVINRARFFLPKPCLKTVYYCLVYPFLYYTPNANMADLSAGPGLVARKRG